MPCLEYSVQSLDLNSLGLRGGGKGGGGEGRGRYTGWGYRLG